MRKILGAVFGLLLLVLGYSSCREGAPTAKRVDPEQIKALLERPLTQQFVPGEVIVKMKTVAGVTMAMPAGELSQLNLEREPRLTSGGEIIYRIAPTTMAALSAEDARNRTLATVESLKARPEVEYSQPNYIYQIATTPQDPLYSNQWHYFNNGTGAGNSPGGINLPIAWDANTGSSDVVVAVLDTGILPDHQDISGSPNRVDGHDMISHTFVANDGDGRDSNPTDPGDAVAANECVPLGSPPHPAQPDSWHGTHVAGTVGVGKTDDTNGVAGVNWNVKVQPVRVLGKCGGTTADITDAIRWAAGLPVPNVPNNTPPAKVINMSLGGLGSCSGAPAYQSAINDAVAEGVTVVVAAGNSAADASNFTPASCNNVITVAASDFRGRLATRYSNFGSTVDIMAPGGDVRRDDNGDGNPDGVLSMVRSDSPLSSFPGGYAFYNGTSMAAPHVAGVAALLLAQDSSLSPSQILDTIKANAIPRSGTECPQPCGAGLLNADIDIDIDGFSLVLDTTEIDLPNVGDTKNITATLTRGGAPQAGETVTFESVDSSVASVSPASAVTNANGEANATVRGESRGNTTVRAKAKGKSAQAPVEVAGVPTISTWGLLLLALVILWLFYRWSRRAQSA